MFLLHRIPDHAARIQVLHRSSLNENYVAAEKNWCFSLVACGIFNLLVSASPQKCGFLEMRDRPTGMTQSRDRTGLIYHTSIRVGRSVDDHQPCKLVTEASYYNSFLFQSTVFHVHPVSFSSRIYSDLCYDVKFEQWITDSHFVILWNLTASDQWMVGHPQLCFGGWFEELNWLHCNSWPVSSWFWNLLTVLCTRFHPGLFHLPEIRLTSS